MNILHKLKFISKILNRICNFSNSRSVIAVFLSGPSGVGKTTIESNLLKINKGNWIRLKSTTTRQQRDKDDANSYNFISEKLFNKMIAEDEFFFYMKSGYSNNAFYGFSKKDIKKSVKQYDVITINASASSREIIQSNLKKMGIKTISIFILPPSIYELKKRIQNRNTDSKEDIKSRLSKAKDEMKFAKKFDYQIINDDLKKTVKQINRIIRQNLK